MNDELERGMEGCGRGLIQGSTPVFFWRDWGIPPRNTSGYPLCGLTFEPRTSRRCANHSTAMSGYHTIFGPEDGDSMFLRNVGICLQVHTALQPRRPTPTYWVVRTKGRTFDKENICRILLVVGVSCYLRSTKVSLSVLMVLSFYMIFLPVKTIKFIYRTKPDCFLQRLPFLCYTF
jgi:hypothetical protein